MTIVLVRHGETDLNAGRVMQPADTPLGARGVRQARAVAQRLAAMPIGAVLSSDLLRALATAQVIADDCNAPLQTSALLRERNFGDLRGQPYDTLGFDPLTMEGAPPGGESAAQFTARVDAAWALVQHTRAALAAPLVVVSHGLVIRAMLSRHCRPDGTAMPPHLANTAVSIVGAAVPHAAELLGCSLHLDTLDADDHRALSGG